MKAQEMFEKLGYVKKETNQYYVEYVKGTVEISFNIPRKLLSVGRWYDTELCAFYVEFGEIKAITQQIKELGWK